MATQKSLISGLWASCYSRCVANGARFMPKIPSRCIRTFVLARSAFRRVSSMMTENNLSKGYASIFKRHLNTKILFFRDTAS